MNKAVILDLDGLLIDSEVISYQLYQDLLNQYGHSFTVEDYTQNYSGKTALGNMEAIVMRYQLPISVQEGLDFTLSRENEYFLKGVNLKKGAKELLNYLKQEDYMVVLASSSTKDRALCALTQHSIEGYFDEMVFGVEVKNGKPSPDIFLKACEKVKMSPENCLVLEDSEAGIQASFTANIPVICVPDMKKPEEKFQKMTETILPSLLEVMSYLQNRSLNNTEQDYLCVKPGSIDEYIATQPEDVRVLLQSIRETIHMAAPEAIEKISWKMPTFWQDENLIHFAAFKKHIGLYPGGEATSEFAERLAGYKTSKGAIQLPLCKQIDYELIADIMRWRVAQKSKGNAKEKF